MPRDTSSLPPFPEGWYFVASRRSLVKAKLIQKTWMGQEIVAWRDDGGRVAVAASVCPHLGSQLGPDAGGRVRDGRLVCPFHGFEFDAGGQCVATPLGKPPRTAQLRLFETRECLGLVFAWWGLDGRPPQWHLPPDPPLGDDWCELGFRTLRFPGHPQETSENSVDVAHLRSVHGYENVRPVGPVTVEGACLTSCFDFTRRQPLAPGMGISFDVSAVVRVVGLGYSFVSFRERSIGLDARFWALATPVDGTRIELVLVSQVRTQRRPKRPIVGLRFLPAGLRARLLNEFLLSAQKHDVLQDVAIWSRKRFLSRPALSGADGEIGKYRRYCRQFYPASGPASGEASGPADGPASGEAGGRGAPEAGIPA